MNEAEVREMIEDYETAAKFAADMGLERAAKLAESHVLVLRKALGEEGEG